MKRLLFILFLAISSIVSAQKTIQADVINATQLLKVGSKTIKGISDEAPGGVGNDSILPTQFAIYNYISNFGATREALINPINTPGYYWNGYKQFVHLNYDSIFDGTSWFGWQANNVIPQFGLNSTILASGKHIAIAVDSTTFSTITNTRRITDSAAAAVLPSQSGNTGKYLTTNGSAASWATVSGGGGSTDTTSLSNRINSIATKLPYFSVADYGAVDDSLTDNTAAIQNTIDTAYAHGGGIVYFPFKTKGKYLVSGLIQTSDGNGNAVTNSQLYIPLSKYANISSAPTIVLKSDYPPSPYSDYTTGQHEATQTVEIISTLGGSNTGSLLGSAYVTDIWGNWNYTQLFLENLTLVTRSVTSGGTDTVATISALDLSSLTMNNLKNVRVKTQSFPGNSSQPLQGTFGVKGPATNNFNASNWTNLFVQGFDKGVVLSENANLTNGNISACDTGIVFALGYHTIEIDRVIVQWCKVNVSIDSLNIFNVNELDMEDYGGSAVSTNTPDTWFNNAWDIYEKDSTGAVGNIKYHMNIAYGGNSHEQDLHEQIISPLISSGILPDPISRLPDRNYLLGKTLVPTVNNDHVVALDFSKITFGTSIGISGATYSYMKIPSNDGADSTSLSFNTIGQNGFHGTDITSNWGDVRIGSTANVGANAIFSGSYTGHYGNLYLNAGFPNGRIYNVVYSNDTVSVAYPTGEINYNNNVGIGLSGTIPTHSLQVGGSVQFTGLNASGLVYTDNTGLLTNSHVSAGDASSTANGVVNLVNQTLGAGIKTMQEVATTTSFDLPASTSSTVGLLTQNGNPFLHSYNSASNVYLGTSAGNFTNYGYNNVGIGSQVMYNLTTGGGNVGVGYQSLLNDTSGSSNVALGVFAGSALRSGNYNLYMGYQAGYHAVDNSNNILIGYQAGTNVYTNANGGGQAGYNIMIGNNAGNTANYNGGYNVLIGHGALNNAASIPSNKFCITGGSAANNLIYGDFNTGQVQINAAQTSPALTPSAALEVVSTNKGLLLPRLTTSQRNSISGPVAGLVIFCTDCIANDSSTGVTETYNGSVWKNNW